MPICTIILHRQVGTGKTHTKSTAFVAEKLRPMLEGVAGNGRNLHVIHENISSIFIDPEEKDFEEVADSRRAIREWKKMDREWRMEEKGRLSCADHGDRSPFGDEISPELKLILETNKKKPGAVRNHIGFYPFDAVVEYSRYKVERYLCISQAAEGHMEESIEHMKHAQNAFAAYVLLQDFELVKQMGHIGHDAVAFRSMHHTYLANLEGMDIPIVTSGGVKNFFEYIREQGLILRIEKEPVDLTFEEQAVSTICSGGIEKDEHTKLALLELLFIAHMQSTKSWDLPGGIEAGLKKVREEYEKDKQDDPDKDEFIFSASP